MSGSKSLTYLLTAFFTAGDHQALGWRLMQLKVMKNLAAFCDRELKKAAEERERDEYSSAKGQ